MKRGADGGRGAVGPDGAYACHVRFPSFRKLGAAKEPAVSVDDVPIGSVTNGVHGRTWVSSEMSDLYTKYVSPAWDEAGPLEWRRGDGGVLVVERTLPNRIAFGTRIVPSVITWCWSSG